MKNTKQITETAILIVIFMILLAVVLYVPFIGVLLLWFLPLLFVINMIKNGRRMTVIMFALVIVLSLIFGIQSLPITWIFASVGLVIGDLYRRQGEQFHILLGGTLTYIANFVLFFILFIIITGINPVSEFVIMMKEMLNNLDQYPQLFGGYTDEQIVVFEEQIEYMKHLAPSFLIISAFLFALITQLITNFMLVRLRFTIKRWKPFHKWSLPKNLIWYYLIVLFLTLVGLEEGTTLFVAVANLLLILENAMILQGFFVIFAFSKIKGWSIALPIVTAVISVLLVIPLQIIKLLGIIDLGFNLRSRMKS